MFVINPYIFSIPYLVDTYSPIGAWSTSKLSSVATNCLRVRRDLDNAELDIPFNGNELDTTTLLSFVGGGDGFVVKWYNQGTGGATYDVIQSITNNQPYIVLSGAVNYDPNTGATSLFSNVGDQRDLATSGTILIDNCSMVSVHRPINGDIMGAICAGEAATGKRRSLVQFTVGTLQMFASGYNANLSLGSVSSLSTYLSHATFDNVNNVVYGSLNGVATSGSITLSTPAAKKITLMSTSQDGDANFEPVNGNFTMAMIWNTNNESNMANVVADINSYYSIY